MSQPLAAAAGVRSVFVEGAAFRVQPTAARRAYWDRVAAGHWEPHTFRALRRFLAPAASCIDIGAWIGPTALYAAHFARSVHALEPDAVAHAELQANVDANPALRARIRLHRECIAPRTGPVTLYAGGMYNTAGAFGDSMSGTVPARGAQPHCSVAGITLEEFIQANAIQDCGLIKMDVEGGEYALIPGRWRQLQAHGMPTLCVSFHAPAPDQRESLMGACLEELRRCYRWLYSAPAQSELVLPVVRDWADETPGSPWQQLDRLLGDGLVATNTAW